MRVNPPQIRGYYLVRDKRGRPKFDEPHKLTKAEREAHRQRPDNPKGLTREEYTALFCNGSGKEIFE